MGNTCSCLCSSKENESSTDIMPEVQGMQHVNDLIAYIDQLMSKIESAVQGGGGQASRPASVASSINSGGNLIEKLSKRLKLHLCKRCLLSTLHRQTRIVLIDVLNRAQHIELVGIGLSIVAYLLERTEQVYSNKEKGIYLLRYISALAKHMKNIDIHLERCKLDDILCFIVKATVICALQIEPSSLCSLRRCISAPLDDDDLNNLESQLVHSYRDLEFQALAVVLHRLPKFSDPSQGEYPQDAVGIEEAQNTVIRLLDLEDTSRRVVVIYGVGGIGKTTLAAAVFNRLHLTGYHHCRVDMVRDSTHSDLQAMQEQILRDVFRENLKLNNCTQGREKLSESFPKASKPVFLFIDNALRQTDIEMLLPIEHFSSLPMQSRILVTTRSLEETKIFELQDGIQVRPHRVDSLPEPEAKRLLCHYALGDKNGSFDPRVNMDGLMQICGRIPLVLKIVGSKLRTDEGNTVLACNEILEYFKDWRRTGLEGGVEDLSERMVDFVYRRLMKPSKEAFLDIAFFFFDWERSKVGDIVGETQLKDLKRAALVTTSEEDKVNIHDIVKALGRKLSEGNRITDRESLDDLLGDEQKLKQTKGIWLTGGGGDDDGHGDGGDDANYISLEAKHLDLMSRSLRVLSLGSGTRLNGRCERAFEDLRFLDISYEDVLAIDLSKSRQLVFFHGHLMKGDRFPELPESLRILHLDACASDSPVSLHIHENLTSLRELQLSNITLENFETSISQLKSLHSLLLHSCEGFTSIPESLGDFSCLKILKLEYCSKLERLPESFGNLSSMQDLHMNFCSKLERLPESFGNISSLQMLRIHECSELQRLPESVGNLSSMRDLHISFCSKLKGLPESIGNLSSLEGLHMRSCSKLERLPESFGNLSSLEFLDIGNCSMLDRLPDSFGHLSSIRELDMSFCSKLERLPDSFGNLSSMLELHMSFCSKLKTLPESFGNLSSMLDLNMSFCSKLERLPQSFGNLSSLRYFHMSNCSKLERLPQSFEHLSSLRYLNISNCSKLEKLLESFGNLSSMLELDMSFCPILERLPQSFGNLPSLKDLNMSFCSKLESLPESFGNLSSMEDLHMRSCSKLERLPESFGNLSSMRVLDMGNCSKLERLPESFGNLSSLRDLNMSNCYMLERLAEGFGNLSSIQDLDMSFCSKLERLPDSFGNLSSMRHLHLSFCSKLERLPEGFGNLFHLRDLHMNVCSKLERLPESFGNLSSLQDLHMSFCSKLERIPESFGKLSSLQMLRIRECSELKRLPESFGNLSSMRDLNMSNCSMLERLPQTFDQLSCLQILKMDGCEQMCSLADNFGKLQCLKLLSLCNCKELKRIPDDIVCLTSLAAMRVYGCAELEAKAMDSLVKIKSLIFLEMGESPMLIQRWEQIQQHRPLVGAALRIEGDNYPYGEIMSTMFFNGGSRFLHLDGDGKLVELASSSFPNAGVKVGLLLTACDLSNELRQKLFKVASSELQIIYVDLDLEGESEADGSSWMKERDKHIRKMLEQLPEGSCAWTSPLHKTRRLFAYSLLHFTGFAHASIVSTSVLVDEEGRRKLSHPLEMIFRTDGFDSDRVELRALFSPLWEAWELMAGF